MTATTDIEEPPRKPRKAATDLDKTLGARLKMSRIAADMSQGELGRRIEVTFQQIQKYENGVNRMTVGVLLRICDELQCPLHEIVPEGYHHLLGIPAPPKPRRKRKT